MVYSTELKIQKGNKEQFFTLQLNQKVLKKDTEAV